MLLQALTERGGASGWGTGFSERKNSFLVPNGMHEGTLPTNSHQY